MILDWPIEKKTQTANDRTPLCLPYRCACILKPQKKMLWPFTTREYYYYTKPNQKKNTKNLSCITCFFSKFSKTVVVVINVVVVVVVNWSIDSMWLRVYMSIRKKKLMNMNKNIFRSCSGCRHLYHQHHQHHHNQRR
mgnify:CR=1 FL=1